MSYGSGKYTYELADWTAKYPEGWSPYEVNGLCVDSQDRLFAFNSGEYPVTIFDHEGNLLSTWPKESFDHNHHGTIGPDDAVYFADDDNHTVSKFTPDGKVLFSLGKKGQPSDTGYTFISENGRKLNIYESIYTTKRSGPPFNSPTDVALSASGEIYVADGYGNARIHKFSAGGQWLFSWGEPGKGPGQFVVPHAIAIDKRGRVLVVDRHNNRVQIFDDRGKFLTQWTDLQLPTDICIDNEDTVYISELRPARISIFNLEGELLARWGNEGRDAKNPLFVTLHTLAVDSRGDIYTGEVMNVQRGVAFMASRIGRMIQKFSRKN
jgi:DNA-binding beta-propeller fold protein YncE